MKHEPQKSEDPEAATSRRTGPEKLTTILSGLAASFHAV